MTFVNEGAGPALLAGLLARHALLAGLGMAVAQAVADGASRRRYGAGKTVFFEGDEAAHGLFVEQGAVEVLRYDSDGCERMLHRFAAGELVAEAALFMPHGLYPMTARTAADCVLWRLPRARVREACQRHPTLALRLLEWLSQRLYHRINEVDWLTSSKAQQRLAAFLVAQAERQGGRPFELPTSQRQLADRLGMRTETLNRMLADWQRRGWIQGGGRRWQLRESATLLALAAPGVRGF